MFHMFFQTTYANRLDGIAAAEAQGPEDFFGTCTFEARSFEAALALIEEWNLEEASCWSDSLTFLDAHNVQVVDGPGEDHRDLQQYLLY